MLHFQDLGHRFSLYGPPSRQITYIYFSPLYREIVKHLTFLFPECTAGFTVKKVNLDRQLSKTFTESQSDQQPVSLVTKLVDHSTSFAEVFGCSPVGKIEFFSFNFSISRINGFGLEKRTDCGFVR